MFFLFVHVCVYVSFLKHLQCAKQTRSLPLDTASKLRASIANIIFMPIDKAGNVICLVSRHWALKAK